MLKELVGDFNSTGTSEAETFSGFFNISVVINTGTIILQRSFNQGQSWLDVETFTASYEDSMHDPEGMLYRWKCTVNTTVPVYGRLAQ